MSDPADLYQSGPSSSSNFIRKWSLTLIGPGGQEYTISDSTAANAVSGGTSTIEDPLRLTFYCRHAMTASRGYAEIEIYNLALVDDVAGLNALYNSVVLRAGYLTGNFGTIFAGQIIDFTQKRAETFTETYLKIRAQSSDFAYNLATTATTFAAGQTAMKAVHQIANAMVAVGAVLGQITGLSEAPFIRGRVSYGQAVDAIQKFGSTFINNGVLNVFPQSKGVSVGDAVTINADTGQIGMAEVAGPNGVSVRCNLNPNLQPGTPLILNNRSINQVGAGQPGAGGTAGVQGPGFGQLGWFVNVASDGQYAAVMVEHSGDSRGNDWQTHVIAWPNGQPILPTTDIFQNVGPLASQIAAASTPPSLPADVSTEYPFGPSGTGTPGGI